MRVLLLLLCVVIGGCTSLKLTDRDRQFQLARAEPLFGQRLDHCLNDPAVLFAIVQDSSKPVGADGAIAVGNATSDDVDKRPAPAVDPANCKEVVDMLTPIVRVVDENGTMNVDPIRSIKDRYRRNEVINALVAISNRKCGDYSAYLKTHDGQVNSSLSILALLTGGLGSVVGGEGAAQALSGTSAFFTGSRSALNETWFSNQTIHVLAAGYEKVRERQLRDIRNRQACTLDLYGSMAGISDALQYHSSCSLLTGLSEAAEAIERADQPGMDTLQRQLADLQALRSQARGLGDYTNLGVSQREIELTGAVNEARRLRTEADRERQVYIDQLAELREDQRTEADVGERDLTAEIASVQSDLDRAEQRYEARNEEFSTASTKLEQFRSDEDRREQQQTSQTLQPSHMLSPVSERAVCPFDGQPGAINATPTAATNQNRR